METEDKSKFTKGATMDFKVLEFNKEYRRIVASHTAVFKEEEEKNVKAAKKKVEASSEKTTLGDISELADLKKKMDKSK
jgi:small subunit ribosomal protein S1